MYNQYTFADEKVGFPGEFTGRVALSRVTQPGRKQSEVPPDVGNLKAIAWRLSMGAERNFLPHRNRNRLKSSDRRRLGLFGAVRV